jgi:hypothetical protein
MQRLAENIFSIVKLPLNKRKLGKYHFSVTPTYANSALIFEFCFFLKLSPQLKHPNAVTKLENKLLCCIVEVAKPAPLSKT